MTQSASDVFDPTTLITRTPPLEAKPPEPIPEPVKEPEKPVEAVKEPEPDKEADKAPESHDEPVDATPNKHVQKQDRRIANLEKSLETFSSTLDEIRELIKGQGKAATPAQVQQVAALADAKENLESQLDALASGSETADFVGADTTLAKEVKALKARLDSTETQLRAELSEKGQSLQEIQAERFWIKESKLPGCDALDCPKIYEKALEDISVEEVTSDLRRILKAEPTTAQLTEEVDERASRLYYRRRDDAAKAQLAKAGEKDKPIAPRSTPKPTAPHLPSPTPDGGGVLARTNGSRPIATPGNGNNNLTDQELATLGREFRQMRRGH